MQASTIKFRDKQTGRSYEMPWSDPINKPKERDFNDFINQQEINELKIKAPEVEKKESFLSKLNKPLTNLPSKLMSYVDIPIAGGLSIPRHSPAHQVVSSIADDMTSPINLTTGALSGGLSLGVKAVKGLRAANEAAQIASKLKKTKELAGTAIKTQSALDKGIKTVEGISTANKLGTGITTLTGVNDTIDSYRQGDKAGMIGGGVQTVASILGFRNSNKVGESLKAVPRPKPRTTLGKNGEYEYHNPHSEVLGEYEGKGYKIEERDGKVFVTAPKKTDTPISQTKGAAPSPSTSKPIDLSDKKVPKSTSELPRLPKTLSGAKPRFINKNIQFENDIDKAAYILYNPKVKPKSHDAYSTFLKKVTGLNDSQIRILGKRVKDSAGKLYNDTPDGENVKLSSVYNPDEGSGGIGLPGFPKSKEELFKPLNPAADKVYAALRRAAPLRGKIKADLGGKRSQAAKAMLNIKPGEKGHLQKLGILRGIESKSFKFTPLNLPKKDIQEVYNLINAKGKSSAFDALHAEEAFRDLLSGAVPTTSRLRELDKVFGENFGKNVIHMHGGIGQVGMDKLENLANDTKSLRAGMDLSIPLRNSSGLIHTREYWKSAKEMMKATFSKDAAEKMMTDIKLDPDLKKFENMGVSFPKNEEYLMSDRVNRLPGYKQTARGIDLFQTKLRLDTAKRLTKNIEAMNLPGDEFEEAMQGMVGFVNNATGRGSLGKFGEKNAHILNTAFFSPRFQASRMHLLNPRNYLNANPVVRKEYAKSALATLGYGYTTLNLMKTLYGGTIEKDPRSSDYMKLKVGDTRFEPWAGFQQYVTFLSRMATGERKSNTSGKITEMGKDFGSKGRLDTVVDFTRSKVSPLVGAAANFIDKKDMVGQEVTGPSTLVSLAAPMFLETVKEVQKNDPELVTPSLLSFFGLNVQSYKPESKKKKNKTAPKTNYLDWLKIR